MRVFPLRDVSRDELAELAGGELARVAPVDGGIVNTIHDVTRVDGARFGVKHFATRERFATELAALERVRGRVPVPDVVGVDGERHAIVYRWLDGITLNELRRREPERFAAFAEEIGATCARIARCAPLPATTTVAPDELCARAAAVAARGRIAPELADELGAAIASLPWHELGEPSALRHGDFGGRNLLVDPATYRLVAVVDWESATTGWPLWDVGCYFRYTKRFDEAYRTAFARGYRGAGGTLPAAWWRYAIVLEAARALASLLDDDVRPHFDEIRELLARVVAAVR